MELKKYNKKICKEAFKDSKWEALLFFTDNQLTEQRFVFSQTIDPKAIFAYEKKVPEFHFMGNFCDCWHYINTKLLGT